MTDQRIAGLIERLEQATGPDREIDFALLTFDPESEWYSGRHGKAMTHAADIYRRETWFDNFGNEFDEVEADYPTASIDAALGLMERLLPGWSVRVFVHPDAAYADVYQLGELTHVPEGKVERRITSDYHEGNFIKHRLPALAIILATLRALNSKDQ